MIKVMWFVKRAKPPQGEEFERWWTETPTPDIINKQVPHLIPATSSTSAPTTPSKQTREEECKWK